MSDQDSPTNRSLVPAGSTDLAPLAAANPLVSRGLMDLIPGHLPKASATAPLAPNDALFYYNRGKAWLDKNDFDAATEDFDRAILLSDDAIRSRPDDALAYLHRGNARLGKAEALNGAEHCDAAIDDFDQAVRLDPKNAQVYVRRGKAWSFKNDYDAAIADFDQAISLNPHNATAYFERNQAWYNIEGWLDRAIADFDEAIRLNPTVASWYYLRGTRWLDGRNPDRAIRDFDEAIRLRPDDAFTYNRRGRAWRSKGEYDRAIKAFDEAIRLAPNHHLFYCDRSLAWLGKKNFDQAAQDFEQAFRVRPKNEFAYRWYAWLLASHPEEKIRDGKRAIQLATLACELAADDPPCWTDLTLLAAAYAADNQFDAAERYQRMALEDSRLPASARDDHRQRLELYKSRKPYRQGP